VSETSEIYGKLRGIARRVIVREVDDSGEMQTATVEVADGILREKVEVLQPFGFTSNPPADGAIGIALAIGGDEGDMMLLPLGNPSSRMGGLGKGDIGIANAHGDRVVVRKGGGIDIQAAGSITLKVGGVTMVLSAAGVAFEGGAVTHNGANIGDTHVHGGILRGGANTDPPSN
jgi:phage baseplate assembly protein V